MNSIALFAILALSGFSGATASDQGMALPAAWTDAGHFVESAGAERLAHRERALRRKAYGCDSRQISLERVLKNDLITPDALVSRLANSGAKVVLIGESHLHRPAAAIASLVGSLHKQGFDCLALEQQDRRCQGQIDQIMSGQVPYADIVRTAPKLCAFELDSGEDIILDQARRDGMKVFAADDLSVGFDQDGMPTESVAVTMPHRNKAMASLLAGLIQGGACSKIVSSNGKSHIVRDFFDERAPAVWASMTDRLNARGIPAAAVEVIAHASYKPKYGDDLAPKECGWNLWGDVPAGQAVAFAPAPPSVICSPSYSPWGDPRNLPYNAQHPVLWTDYAGVVLVP